MIRTSAILIHTIFWFFASGCLTQNKPAIEEVKLIKRVEKISELPETITRGNLGLFFLNDKTGWFFQGNNLWHSVNYGKTWTQTARTIGATQTQKSANAQSNDFIEASLQVISHVFFSTTKIGWVVTLKDIYYTEDGGVNLKKVTPVLDSITDVNFLKNGEIIYVLGKVYDENTAANSKLIAHHTHYLFYSSNRGDTWTQIAVPADAAFPSKIFFTDEGYGWVLAANVITKFDKGEWRSFTVSHLRCESKATLQKIAGLDEYSYEKYTTDGFPIAIDMFFIENDTGWVSLSSGEIISTIDGGHNWCSIFVPEKIWKTRFISTDYFSSLFFDKTRCGWGLDGRGGLFEMKNGGIDILLFDPDLQFERIYFRDCSHGWAICSDGIYRIMN